MQLSQANTDLAEEVKYLKKVEREQSKALNSSAGSERVMNQLKGQAEELRHMKRKKHDMQIEKDRVEKQNQALHEANSVLIQ